MHLIKLLFILFAFDIMNIFALDFDNQSRNLKVLSYDTYKDKFQKNIDYYIFLFIAIVFGYRFISSICNIFKKRIYSFNTSNKEYNVSIYRRSYLKFLELFVYYIQIISLLILFNLNKFNNLNIFANKLGWINLFDINITTVSDVNCKSIDFFFKNHFIFALGIFILSFGNILITFVFDTIYKYKLNLNSDPKNDALLDIYKDDYMIFPNVNIQWVLFALLPLITTETLIINKTCRDFFILGTGLMLVIPFLFSIYVIATIKNKISSKEELTYNINNRPITTRFIENNNRSLIDIFNRGCWSINTDIKFCKSHFPIFIDLVETKYMYIHLLKNFIFGIITGINVNNKISFSIFVVTYVIDAFIIIIIRPYNNIVVNIVHLLTNLSLISTFTSLLISKNDKHAMYIITFTLISYIIVMIVELLGLFVIELFVNIKKITLKICR